MLVRDDGIGIPKAFLEEGRKEAHWGLLGMKERAAGLGGSIEVRNRKGKGAEVVLRVPAERAYA
jgi:nitrate/nitrite-specific signal transduction histidine kinase